VQNRQPVGVTLADALSDTVIFDVPDRVTGQHLARWLRPGRVGAVHEWDGFWLYAAELRPIEGDLATLLREVEAWLGERGIPELWFSLDGRTYLIKCRELESAPAA
jgi:hypothetical protein